MSVTPPRGVWYEEARNRWRVQVYFDGALVEKSYHRSYESAIQAHAAAKQGRFSLENEQLVSARNKFLYGKDI
mgnify:CR=1 FL=1